MIGDFGLLEMMLLLLIGVLVFGGDLPEVGRRLGRLWGSIQSYLDMIKRNLREETDDLKDSVDVDPIQPDKLYDPPEPGAEKADVPPMGEAADEALSGDDGEDEGNDRAPGDSTEDTSKNHEATE